MSEMKLKMRNQQTVFHHLFKGLVATAKKNNSYVAGLPEISAIEHCHFFHTVNSSGLPQKYTNAVNGHVHEITWKAGKDGVPMAECGPALKKVIKQGRNGLSVVKYERVRFYDKHDGKDVEDNHIHEMEYQGSDELSTKAIQETQTKNAQMIQSMKPKESFENDEVRMESVPTASRGRGAGAKNEG